MPEKLFVKLCGLSTEQDVDVAVEAGADAVGFVFAPSPRQVGTDTARALARRVPPGVLTVGVFRNQPVGEVRAMLEESGVRAAQLHGDETPEDFAALALDGRTLLRAASCPAPGGPAPRCGEFGEDLLLVDAPTPGAGVAWDWSRTAVPGPDEKWLLAGGLSPENVAEAVRAVRPWGVDVSSGIERSRGVKDPALIEAFVRAARAARAAEAG